MGGHEQIPIGRVTAASYIIPTDAPESDGTIAWDSTTMVAVEVEAGGKTGFGYTYCDASARLLIEGVLSKTISHTDAFAIEARWEEMNAAVRNIGRPGVASCAISAIDIALWDLKAKHFGAALANLLGCARRIVPVYGSGGFTSYDDAQLRDQLGGWVAAGCRRVKMKVGRTPERDVARVETAKRAIGCATLFVDANGAYARKQALQFAGEFAQMKVAWLEEPVSSDDLDGLRLLRDRAPCGMEIAAGEYGYTPYYFRAMLEAGAVDVLQADATRCGGITGFMRAAALCDGFEIPLSSHCAPAIHLAAACAAPRLEHMEWFHDHVRIEHMLLDGAPHLVDGSIAPDLSRPGHGLQMRKTDARRFET
ncbi:MAG TPA: enolase C-terminal domain-like protein [Rhizomicrobium sp.]|nr:enolase C-terminal domain-like protein [Rhizomicrobium sp.]